MTASVSGLGPRPADDYAQVAPKRDTRPTLKIGPGSAGPTPAPQPVAKNTNPQTPSLSPPAQAMLKAGDALEAALKAKGTPQEFKLASDATFAAEDNLRVQINAYNEKAKWAGKKVTNADLFGVYAAYSLLRRAQNTVIGRAENSSARLHQLARDIEEADKLGDSKKVANLKKQYKIAVKENYDLWQKALNDFIINGAANVNSTSALEKENENDVVRDGREDAEAHMVEIDPKSIPDYHGHGRPPEPLTWRDQVALVDQDYQALQREKQSFSAKNPTAPSFTGNPTSAAAIDKNLDDARKAAKQAKNNLNTAYNNFNDAAKKLQNMSPSDPARPQAIIVALQKADELEKAAVASTEGAGKVSSASNGTYDSKKLDEAEKGLKDAVAEETRARELVWNLRQKYQK
jgi:hypothetical protein